MFLCYIRIPLFFLGKKEGGGTLQLPNLRLSQHE